MGHRPGQSEWFDWFRNGQPTQLWLRKSGMGLWNYEWGSLLRLLKLIGHGWSCWRTLQRQILPEKDSDLAESRAGQWRKAPMTAMLTQLCCFTPDFSFIIQSPWSQAGLVLKLREPRLHVPVRLTLWSQVATETRSWSSWWVSILHPSPSSRWLIFMY